MKKSARQKILERYPEALCKYRAVRSMYEIYLTPDLASIASGRNTAEAWCKAGKILAYADSLPREKLGLLRLSLPRA